MTHLPFDIGTTHFVGIGGIGMSGIAEVMHRMGLVVQGSDQAEGGNVVRLREMGIHIAVGHSADNIADASAIVVSSAVTMDNPELRAASERNVPILKRADMLAELMRFKWCVTIAGTHGKTTTTSLVAALLEADNRDPTVVNGGIMNAYGSNARLGAGKWMIAEADESDGTFVRLPAAIGVITNIDPEHLDHYGSQSALEDAFVNFARNVPYYGALVVNGDHPGVAAIIDRIDHCKIISFGFSQGVDIQATNLTYENGEAVFDVQIGSQTMAGLRLPMAGKHNILNALAALGVARQLGVEDATIARGLAGVEGVQRRFTHVADIAGVHIIDDYAHHPVEIEAVLSAAREAYQGRVVAVVQPHRYTRLRDLFDGFCQCFGDADMVMVADVFAAGEAPITGFDRAGLAAGVAQTHSGTVIEIESEAALADAIQTHCVAGDVVVCLGAGSISDWSRTLPTALAAAADGGGAA
jgi:UDP-N-acetylmuramate--alanine ligase